MINTEKSGVLRYDIAASTNDSMILKGVYRDSLPVAYSKKTTDKIDLTFEDLCKADMMAFGSDIGQITNKSTSMYAMMYNYSEDSAEYNELHNRLIRTRVAQGNSIDRFCLFTQ